jgi:tetratricopeptide (TPR) repeat protein
VSDAKDSEYHFKGILNYKELFYFLKIQFENLSSPLFWLGLPFFIWGLRYLWVTYQILSVALVVLIGINSFFFYYWIDGTSAFLPTIVCFFLLVGLGLGQFGRYLGKRHVPRKIATIALVFFLAGGAYFTLPKRFSESDYKSGFMAIDLFWPDLANLPPDSLAIHHSQWFSELALQHLYVARPDVSLLWYGGLVQPQFFSPLVPAKNPTLIFPYLADGSPMPPETPNYISYFLVPNMDAGKPVYLQFGEEIDSFMPYMAPEKPLMWLGRLTQDKWMADKVMKNGDYATYLKWFREYVARLAAGNDPPLAAKAPAYLMYISSPVFRQAVEKKRPEDGVLAVEALLNAFSRPDGTFMFPSDVTLNLHAFLANSYRRVKNYSEAIKYAKKLIDLSPYNPNSHYILGLTYDNQANSAETLKAWRTATDLDKYDLSFLYHYHLALAKYKSINEAVSFLEGRAKFYEEENMPNLRTLTLKFRDCLLLPPEEIGEPVQSVQFEASR